jgi:protein gp37
VAENSLIAWTDHTLNPWMGCSKVSQGCKHCYAITLTQNRMGIDVFGNSPRQRTRPQVWNRPLRWNREAAAEGEALRVFCASLADVFEDHPQVNEWRPEVFDLIRRTPWLDWQLLTKRPENFKRMLPDDWTDVYEGYPNVWLGTSIEDNRVAHRAHELLSVPAFNHFVSYEPAIGPLDIGLHDIEWMIVGGESGPGHRTLDLGWAESMRLRCKQAGVAYFFKQNSGHRTEMGIDALGRVYREYPATWDREGVGRVDTATHRPG